MAKSIYEMVKEVIDKPITGHPSREMEQKIKRLEEAILELAHHASMVH